MSDLAKAILEEASRSGDEKSVGEHATAARESARIAQKHATSLRKTADQTGHPEHAQAATAAEASAKAARYRARKAEASPTPSEAEAHAEVAALHAERNTSRAKDLLGSRPVGGKLQVK